MTDVINYSGSNVINSVAVRDSELPSSVVQVTKQVCEQF